MTVLYLNLLLMRYVIKGLYCTRINNLQSPLETCFCYLNIFIKICPILPPRIRLQTFVDTPYPVCVSRKTLVKRVYQNVNFLISKPKQCGYSKELYQ